MLNAPLGLSCCFSFPPFAQGEELGQSRVDSTPSAAPMARRIPPLIEDRLSLLGATHEIPLSDLHFRLERLIELNPLTDGYLSWMGLVDEIETQYQPYIRARAFRHLITAVGIEFELQDPYVLEFILANLATLAMPGDPVWGFIVGPPSALKTEFLRWTKGLPQVYTLSRLTAHSLISGLKAGSSLLPDLDNRVLVIKDFTTVLEGDRKAREEIFAQLRDAFDGYYEGHFGTVGKLSYAAHFHVLAAVTPAIEEYWSVQSSLGARFLKVRVPPLDGFDRCLAQGGREEDIRIAFYQHVKAVVDRLDVDAWKSVRLDRVQEIRPVVELLARGRTHVNRFDGQISSTPEPEMLPRLTKQLRKLSVGRALLYGRSELDDSDLAFLRRVALDTLPANRAKLLQALEVASTVDQLSTKVRLPPSTVYRHLEDLLALDLVAGDGGRPESFRLHGAAAKVVTPHTREKMAQAHFLKEVGGDPAARAAETDSWMEPPVDTVRSPAQ
jgi:hypothetical protein